MISMLAMAAMVSCTSEGILDDETPDNSKGLVPIKLSASIIGVETKGAVDKTMEITDVAILKAETTTTDLSSFTWATANVTTKTGTIAANTGAISLTDGTLYYPTDPNSSAVIGAFYPKASATVSNGTVTFAKDDIKSGDKDIMWAGKQNGNKTTSTSLALSFSHKLSQLQFKFVKDASFSSAAKVDQIVIKGTKLPASMSLEDGTITYETTASDITVSNLAIDLATVTNPVIVLVQPSVSGITLDISLDDGTKIENVAIQSLSTAESSAHEVTLNFKQKEISATATIGKWETGSTGSAEVI